MTQDRVLGWEALWTNCTALQLVDERNRRGLQKRACFDDLDRLDIFWPLMKHQHGEE